MSEQEALDRDTQLLRRAIRILDGLADRAGKKADELCTPETCAASADMRDLEALLRGAASTATAAYAAGRRLQIPSGDGIIGPAFGGDGKG